MSADFSHSELFDLLSALSDETIAEEQGARLAALLLETPAARQIYFSYVDMNACLAQLGEISSCIRVSTVTANSVLTPENSTREVSPDDVSTPGIQKHRHFLWQLSASPFRSVRDRRALSVLSAMLAVACMLAIMAYFRMPRIGNSVAPPERAANSQASIVAHLSQAYQVRWGENQSLAPGAPLHLGQELELREGIVELRFKSGAIVLLEAPATFTLDGQNGGTLRQGRLIAKVNRRAVGFTIETPEAIIVDLGTEFGAWVHASGQTLLNVFSGKVEITERAQSTHSLVEAGQAYIVGEGAAGGASQAHVAFNRLRQSRVFVHNQPGKVLFEVASIPRDADDEVVLNDGDYQIGLNVGLNSPEIVLNGVPFKTLHDAVNNEGVKIAVAAPLNDPVLPVSGWKENLAKLFATQFATHQVRKATPGQYGGATFDVIVAGLTPGTAYRVQFFCGQQAGDREMLISSGHQSSGAFNAGGVPNTTAQRQSVVATFIADSPSKVFTIGMPKTASPYNRAILSGVAVFSLPRPTEQASDP